MLERIKHKTQESFSASLTLTCLKCLLFVLNMFNNEEVIHDENHQPTIEQRLGDIERNNVQVQGQLAEITRLLFEQRLPGSHAASDAGSRGQRHRRRQEQANATRNAAAGNANPPMLPRRVLVDEETLHGSSSEGSDREARRRRRRQEADRQRRLHGVRINIPYFSGASDADAYQDWEVKTDQVFRFYRYTEMEKVELATIHFTDFALSWWREERDERERDHDEPIDTWEELKQVMRSRFIPIDHEQQLLLRIERLRQGNRSPDEYYKDLRSLLQRSGSRQPDSYILAKFLAGLNSDVGEVVEQLRHTSPIDALHHATHIYERNLKKRAAAPSRRWNT